MRTLRLQDVLSVQRHNFELMQTLDDNLHSPERLLIELRMAHAELNASVDTLSTAVPVDELTLRRLKKRRLALRDQISRLEIMLDPKEPA
jgi:hypothetical protein